MGDAERYRSYLLRLWRESPGVPWRVHLHCVQTGAERRFAGLAALFAFLDAEASENRDVPAGSAPSPGT